ncbi:MAG: hypothetical protein NZ937_03865 [Armatimonadetes bacterium]|nr:hypothetical protein [Armatimonadota bacterium]
MQVMIYIGRASEKEVEDALFYLVLIVGTGTILFILCYLKTLEYRAMANYTDSLCS